MIFFIFYCKNYFIFIIISNKNSEKMKFILLIIFIVSLFLKRINFTINLKIKYIYKY